LMDAVEAGEGSGTHLAGSNEGPLPLHD
jgi:hypothetical protein